MSLKNKAWLLAGTATAVEMSKDQRLRKWGSAIGQKQNVMNNMGQVSTQVDQESASASSSSSSASSFPAPSFSSSKQRDMQERDNQSEESLRIVMYLSCWGPY